MLMTEGYEPAAVYDTWLSRLRELQARPLPAVRRDAFVAGLVPPSDLRRTWRRMLSAADIGVSVFTKSAMRLRRWCLATKCMRLNSRRLRLPGSRVPKARHDDNTNRPHGSDQVGRPKRLKRNIFRPCRHSWNSIRTAITIFGKLQNSSPSSRKCWTLIRQWYGADGQVSRTRGVAGGSRLALDRLPDGATAGEVRKLTGADVLALRRRDSRAPRSPHESRPGRTAGDDDGQHTAGDPRAPADHARHRPPARLRRIGIASALSINAAFDESAFTASDITARAATDAGLRGMQALAGITTTRQLGCWLRRVRGTTWAG